jgi:hypothetical protein
MSKMIFVAAATVTLALFAIPSIASAQYVVCIDNSNKHCGSSLAATCRGGYYRHGDYQSNDRWGICRLITGGTNPNLNAVCLRRAYFGCSGR